jgi:hypothetical protein
MPTSVQKSRSIILAAAIGAVVALHGTGLQAAPADTQAVAFSVQLGGALVFNATSYQLETVERNNKVFYVLKVTRRVTGDASLVGALQIGTMFNPAVVRLYDSTAAQVATYSLPNAVVSGVQCTGAVSNGAMIEEIALSSASLVATAP